MQDCDPKSQCCDGERVIMRPSNMLTVAALLLARTLVIPGDAGALSPIECPVGQSTRIVFPEALRTLRIDARTKARLGLSVEQASPLAIVVARPQTAGAEGALTFDGPTLSLAVRLVPTSGGTAGEVRLVRETAPPATVESTAVPSAAPALTSPTVRPAAAAPVGTARPDMAELLQAQAIPVGRREGLPGEHELVLVDALKGRSSVWLRFLLEGGAGEHVDEVSWEQGTLADVVQEAAGRDLQVVVAVPREGITKRSVVSVHSGGRAYEFSFSASAFRGLLKALEK
jgi:hypothetical protein